MMIPSDLIFSRELYNRCSNIKMFLFAFSSGFPFMLYAEQQKMLSKGCESFFSTMERGRPGGHHPPHNLMVSWRKRKKRKLYLPTKRHTLACVKICFTRGGEVYREKKCWYSPRKGFYSWGLRQNYAHFLSSGQPHKILQREILYVPRIKKN